MPDNKIGHKIHLSFFALFQNIFLSSFDFFCFVVEKDDIINFCLLLSLFYDLLYVPNHNKLQFSFDYQSETTSVKHPNYLN